MSATMRGAAMEHQSSPLVGVERVSISLGPDEDFPADLAGLSLVRLQVLHFRICSQLYYEFLTEPVGAHPVTLDWSQELVAELGSRHSCLSA